MAGTASTKLAEFHQDSIVEQLRLSLNAVIVDLETLRVAIDAIGDHLDADADVTNLDDDYASTAAVTTAAALTAWLVNKQ